MVIVIGAEHCGWWNVLYVSFYRDGEMCIESFGRMPMYAERLLGGAKIIKPLSGLVVLGCGTMKHLSSSSLYFLWRAELYFCLF